MEWLAASPAALGTEVGKVGFAHLKAYTAEYREWGNGPPLVLVPGLAGGYPLVELLAQKLASHYRVLSYQLRGEDDVFALRRQFSLADLVDDLEQFLDWHRLESPAIFGVSFGGILALELAARQPYRLRALGVQGVGARFEPGLLQRVASMVLAGYPLPPDNPFVNQFFNLFFGGRQRPQHLFDFVTRQCWRTDQSVMAHRFRLIEQFNLIPRLGRIRVPTLVFAGDREMVVSEPNRLRLLQGLRRGKLVQLPGAGHLAFVTHARQMAAEMQQFLEE
jgi:aminoacrylate hydrolase